MRRMLGVGTVLAGALALGSGGGARADEPAAGAEASAVVGEVAAQDPAITLKIRNELLASDLRRLNIAVGTSGGVVTLTGTVASDSQRRMAVDMARHTGGVTRVDDQIRVVGSTPADPEVPPR